MNHYGKMGPTHYIYCTYPFVAYIYIYTMGLKVRVDVWHVLFSKGDRIINVSPWELMGDCISASACFQDAYNEPYAHAWAVLSSPFLFFYYC